MDLKFCLSFDVGGTFIKYAVIDSLGKIHLKDKVKTPGAPCKETIPNIMIEVFNSLKDKYEISCIGISTAGQVNIDRGVVEYAVDSLPEYSNTDFRGKLGKALNLPVFVDNDVNSAAAGEMWIGNGKDLKNFLCVTLGTGVGGAIVINKEVYRGENFSGGEIGHFIIVPEGNRCNCGRNGCYERYASTSALIRMYRECLKENNLPCEENYEGEYIVDLYYKGDEIATRVYERFLDYIAYGLANLTHILDPGIILVGGGISAQGERFFNEINKRFKKYAMISHKESTIVKQAGLTNDAGVIGAAFNAFKFLNVL